MTNKGSILIKNGYVLTMNPYRQIIRDGAVYIKEGKIVEVGKTSQITEHHADTVLDAKGMIVMPGLIDTHVHLAQALIRGCADDVSLVDWLKNYVWVLQGNFTNEDGRVSTELCMADPEFLEAWYLLASALKGKSISTAASQKAFMIADCQSAIFALGGNIIPSTPLPSWARAVLESRQALTVGEIELAEEHLHPVLVVDPLPPLVAISHLYLMRASQLPTVAVQNLADFYHQRFPNTLAPVMFLADALMDSGEPEKAVSLYTPSDK